VMPEVSISPQPKRHQRVVHMYYIKNSQRINFIKYKKIGRDIICAR